MRSRHVAAALTAVTAGLTVAVALHRRTGSRLPVPVTAADAVAPPAPPAPSAPSAPPALVEPVLEHEGVVLPFVRPVTTAPAAEPAAPARCGDNGGRTKAGSACAARATSGGRCHHHPVAA
jgi:hypothetical protein